MESELALSGIIVDIILFFIVAGNAIIGYKRGLVSVIFSICSSIIAIILVVMLYKPVTNYIIDNTTADEKLQGILQEKIADLVTNRESGQEEASVQSGLVDLFIGDKIENFLQDTTNSIVTNVSSEIAKKIISVLVFFILFAVIRLVLYIIKTYIELIANLPIIRIFNSSGGMIYGIVKGVLLIYVSFAIISLLLPILADTIVITAIQNSFIGSKMFESNILLQLIL